MPTNSFDRRSNESIGFKLFSRRSKLFVGMDLRERWVRLISDLTTFLWVWRFRIVGFLAWALPKLWEAYWTSAILSLLG